MKKFINIILSFCLILTVAFTFAGCGKDNENNQAVSKIEIDYVKNLQLNSTNNTAYGLKKSTIENTTNMSTQSLNAEQVNTSFVNLKSVLNAPNNRDNREKYYLYSTSQKYENGNVEYDANSIQKVTFKKKTTINEDIYDNKGNVISSNQTITQEDISAQVNKLYVTGKYMFMQFIPILFESGNYNYYEGDTLKTEYLEVRPSSLTYDLNGISEFDTKNYYSSALSQSFVIDNETGYIYKIENFSIASIIDSDLVKDSNNNIYKMSKNNQGTLSFIDVMPNKDVQILYENIATDKYGYTFVYNDKIEQVDSENKIIYYKRWCMIDKDKNVYLIASDTNSGMYHINKVYINGIAQDVDNNLTCFGLTNLSGSSETLIGYHKGKRIYNFNLASSDAGGLVGIENSLTLSGVSHPKWYDYSSILIYEDNILYGKVVNLDEYYNTRTILNLNDFTKISEDQLFVYTGKYYLNVGNDKKLINNVYYKATLTGTTYYQLVRNGDTFQLELLEDKNYTQNIFIFQPINK